ncbi:hypothetical protein WMF37_31805 [Sorangium sp. So ce291]|uniref:hypothetical protein n=1 Tax=Sorangium sp. So ce291 TaxID=3133294 RepID=UPI003F64769E
MAEPARQRPDLVASLLAVPRSPTLAARAPSALSRALGRLPLLVAPALAACGAAAEPAPALPGAIEPPHGARALAPLVAPAALGPARYVAQPAPGLVERVILDGHEVDRVVLNGQRAELHGLERIAPLGAESPELAGGAAFPAWARASALRYLFWSGKEIHAAASFSGELRTLTALPGDVVSVFPWLDGLGLISSAGSFAVHGASGALRPLGLPSIVAAAAASERRALGLTVFGRALLTVDAGASYRDITAELGDAASLEVRGDEIVVSLAHGLERAIDPSGRVGEPRAPRAQPPADVDPGWLHRAPFAQLADAVSSGLPLSDGGAAVASDGFVGRVDLASGRASSGAPLPPGSGACAPFRASDALLAVCAGPDRASVVDIASGDARAPRIERAFELRPGVERDTDHFVGVDGEALGYLGPCEGLPRPRLDLREISRGALAGGSTQQSAVFCVRRGPGAWVEHRLDPADATDVLAWIPRRGGGAVALVARPGVFLRDAERVEVRGALRVVRIARSEPPLLLPQHGDRPPELLSLALAALADGTIEGWLPAQGHAARLASVAIDATGRPRLHPLPPRASSIEASGPFALVETEDGRLFETIDRGMRWSPVAPPPGSAAARLEGCSAVGCRVGPFLRIGWASAPRSGAPPPDAAAAEPPAGRAQREAPVRPSPPPPVVRLACSFAGPPAAARVPESHGFGAVAAPPLRGASPLRLGTLGQLTLPSSSAALPAPFADAELAWIPPLDVGAEIRRAVVPLGSAGLAELAYRPYEAQVGLVIDRDGRVAPVAAGAREACLAGVLDAALVTRPIGGCAPPRAVGVDLGDRAIFLSPRHDGLAVSAVELREGAGARRAASTSAHLGRGGPPPALRELHVQRAARAAPASAQQARFAYGAGARGGEPVFVAVAASGGAVLSPVDPELGTLGPEEALAPLGELGAGSAPSCAPRRGEARVVLPFDSEIGLVPGALPGVIEAGTAGVAVIRWSRDRACLDAVELTVRDERYETDFGFYEPPGTVKKLVARFAGPAPAASSGAPARAARGGPGLAPPPRSEPAQGAGGGKLVLVLHGQEVRQPVRCEAVGR